MHLIHSGMVWFWWLLFSQTLPLLTILSWVCWDDDATNEYVPVCVCEIYVEWTDIMLAQIFLCTGVLRLCWLLYVVVVINGPISIFVRMCSRCQKRHMRQRDTNSSCSQSYLKVAVSPKPERPHPPKLVCMHVTSIPICINFLSWFRSIKFFADHGL